jgi:hypothetical protein
MDSRLRGNDNVEFQAPLSSSDPGSSLRSVRDDAKGCDSHERSLRMTKPSPSRFHPHMTAVIRPSKSSGLGLARELAARAEGYTCIAGLDEVGRGPDLPRKSILFLGTQ